MICTSHVQRSLFRARVLRYKVFGWVSVEPEPRRDSLVQRPLCLPHIPQGQSATFNSLSKIFKCQLCHIPSSCPMKSPLRGPSYRVARAPFTLAIFRVHGTLPTPIYSLKASILLPILNNSPLKFIWLSTGEHPQLPHRIRTIPGYGNRAMEARIYCRDLLLGQPREYFSRMISTMHSNSTVSSRATQRAVRRR